MKNMKLMVKLSWGFTIVALIVLVVGYFGLTGASRAHPRASRDIGGETACPGRWRTCRSSSEATDDRRWFAENAYGEGIDAASSQDAYSTVRYGEESTDDHRRRSHPSAVRGQRGRRLLEPVHARLGCLVEGPSGPSSHLAKAIREALAAKS